MKITHIGIDLAKHVFSVHGVDGRGHCRLRRDLRRAQMLKFFANLNPCVLALEACASAHYWARELGQFGHAFGQVELGLPGYPTEGYVRLRRRMPWVRSEDDIVEGIRRIAPFF